MNGPRTPAESIRLRERLGPAIVPRPVEARIAARALLRVRAARARRRPLLALAAVGVGLAAALLIALLRPPSAGPVAKAASRPFVVTLPVPAPSVGRVHAPSRPSEAAAPSVAPAQAPLEGPRTAALGRHRVALGARGRLRPLAAPPGQVLLALEDGPARFEVAHLGPAERFEVRADPVAVEVVGTKFRVEREAGCSSVTVEEGQVWVRFRDAVVARLAAADERRFCASPAGGLVISAPGEGLVRAALTLISEGRDLPRAVAMLERYRREQPGGVLEQEALFHLVRLEARLGQRGAAARLLGELAGRFPEDERLPALRASVRGASR
jgi:hypothetical protein